MLEQATRRATSSGAPSALRLTIVVLAFNEATNLERVIDEALATLSGTSARPYELLIVNDGSTDGTREVAEALQARHAEVRVIHHPRNRGFGGALRTGLTGARGDLISFIPGDGEVKVDQALGLLDRLGDAEMVVSARRCANESQRRQIRPMHREALSWGFHLLTRTILGVDPKGMEGIFLVRRRLLDRVQLRSTSGLLGIELVLACRRLGVGIARGEMIASPRLGGRSKVTNARSIAKSVVDMVKVRLASRRGVGA